MSKREFHYRWEWQLESDPDSLWPLVADTNRFNRETGLPPVRAAADGGRSLAATQAFRRRLQLSMFGMQVEWEEEPFEWVRPKHFGVVRHFTRGPVAELRMRAEFLPRPAGGTHLIFEVWVKPGGFVGRIAIPWEVGWVRARRFDRTVRKFDRMITSGKRRSLAAPQGRFVAGGRERLASLRQELISQGASPRSLDLLVETIERGDDLTVGRLRPYVLADEWNAPRREVLELCLMATRAGLLDYRWELICPHCRGSNVSRHSLREIDSEAYCESCRIDFTVSFDRLVELTFRPSAAIHEVEFRQFCVGGPGVTPHIEAQQVLNSRETRSLAVQLSPGRYLLRTIPPSRSKFINVSTAGAAEARVVAGEEGPTDDDVEIAPLATLHLENRTTANLQFVVEQTAWSDHVVTAADVTALQRFRDLFAGETLRRGEQISVGSLTVLFTDLRDSTHLYLEIGDAPAFDCVLNHFEILQQAIAEEDGAIVKTIGDAIMAVFRRPVGAVNAAIKAQQRLANPPSGKRPLILKAGIHYGHCIAVNLNERLDYFGSTVNLASRLEGLSRGDDIVISSAVHADPEVTALLSDSSRPLVSERLETTLKGFDQTRFEVWRIHNPAIEARQERGSSHVRSTNTSIRGG